MLSPVTSASASSTCWLGSLYHQVASGGTATLTPEFKFMTTRGIHTSQRTTSQGAVLCEQRLSITSSVGIMDKYISSTHDVYSNSPVREYYMFPLYVCMCSYLTLVSAH